MNFEELSVRPEIVRSLKEMGIEEPTQIQRTAIPIIKTGKDVIGMSNTGSGKTVAFGVPLIESIIPGNGPQALIMAPTRELAAQISQELEKFAKYLRFSVATVFGGVALGPQVEQMGRSDIIVSTPGRMLDHLQRRNVDLSHMKCVVLDEADKMVEMGFIEDVDKILQATPRKKQVLLFGATISDDIEKIKRKHMNSPSVAKAETYVKEEYLEQYYYNVEAYDKFSLLVHLLRNEKTDQSLVFCAKRSTVELVTKNLRMQGVKAEMIHGKLSQNKRLSIMEDFKKGKFPILVASAVAARGLDIRDVSHVFNYDLSQDPQEYIHRIGRTARAGDKGKAITLLSPNDHDAFSNVLRYFDVKVDLLPNMNFQRLKFDAGSRRRGSFFNRRFGQGDRWQGMEARGEQRGPRPGRFRRSSRSHQSNGIQRQAVHVHA
ncbi:MAG: DEAD/DEAH box helicase [Nanoarchaeota archaeon]|nr:DEAD/DEAH box helicase [Nanoarchaeota archaeon]